MAGNHPGGGDLCPVTGVRITILDEAANVLEAGEAIRTGGAIGGNFVPRPKERRSLLKPGIAAKNLTGFVLE